ncbi:MAG: tetratricopeptide repeat protein [Betaproteobacteria bacterium]|nr:tetratricopeptide repeat protein [Betaproteobacteria bacterium]
MIDSVRSRLGNLIGLVTVVVVVGLAVPPAASAWGPISRDQALEMVKDRTVGKQRQGYITLADVGTMDDIPLLLSALRDPDDLIRGVAEQSIWGIWMRANDTTVDRLFQMGLDLSHQLRLGDAESEFDRVIAMRPEFAEAWYRRAEVKVMGDRWQEAERDFAKALELNPYHFGALEGLGQCAMHLGRNIEAIDYFRRALELNPNLVDVRGALQRARSAAERERT